MKKVVSLLLAFAAVSVLSSVYALNISAEKYGNFEYEVLSLSDKTCKITGYTGNEETLDIPQSINGLTVTALDDYSFQDYSDLKEINIPNS